MASRSGSLRTHLEALTVECRAVGAKVTPQRLAVYHAVAASKAHPGPEDVFLAVRRDIPTLSLGTVYKTLEFLERLRLLVRVANEEGARRYDARLSTHHHLVCTACGSIVDFDDPALDALAPEMPDPGFVASRVSVQVLGMCAACARSESDRNDPNEAPAGTRGP